MFLNPHIYLHIFSAKIPESYQSTTQSQSTIERRAYSVEVSVVEAQLWERKGEVERTQESIAR